MSTYIVCVSVCVCMQPVTRRYWYTICYIYKYNSTKKTGDVIRDVQKDKLTQDAFAQKGMPTKFTV